MFGELMKFSYLCRVERKMEKGASARQEYFSGAPKFTACPERKNFIRKATKRVSKP
jgi:hypothetical protein